MLHYLKLNDKPFEAIKSGYKKIEMRLFDEKRQKIKVGDNIEFSKRDNSEEKILVAVKALHIFNSFQQLYQEFDKSDLGYRKEETADYRDMQEYYSLEQQHRYGVVGIEIELLE